MKACCPAKLILSGEHAIVQGAPALAIAVNRHAFAEATPLSDPMLEIKLDGHPTKSIPLEQLGRHLEETRQRHHAYLNGDLPIRDVTPLPEDLLFAAAAFCPPSRGVRVHIGGDIPRGCGLGSSAAMVLALLKCIAPEKDRDFFFRTALTCEHYQHGHSSGLDVATSLYGGLVKGQKGKFEPIPSSNLPPFQVYNSGHPESTTGECVAAVRARFPESHPIWDKFASATNHIERAVQEGDTKGWIGGVRENHRLLVEIDVVPKAIQSVAKEVENSGGALKICGAGSLHGDQAGMVLITGTVPHHLPRDWEPMNL